MKDLRAIILAAGKGTRMKTDYPKVLHRICGRPILQYILELVKSVGSRKTYVVLGHQITQIRELLTKDHEIIEQKKLLGTADAVKAAESKLRTYRGDVLVLCGDTPLLNKSVIKLLVKKHKKSKAACTFLTTVLHNPAGYGRIIRDPKGKVTAIREDKDAVGFEKSIAEINVGVYCFQAKELFAGLKLIQLNLKKKEFYLTDIIELFSSEGKKVETIETEDPNECLGINTKIDLAKAQKLIRMKILERHMLDGVSIMDPDTTYIDDQAKIGKDTVIRPYTFIEGNVKIGSNCTIGPFAHLRDGTRIGNGVEVGNFAEINRTKIGDKSLVKHFCYLGDTICGTSVNIGAGTVTANFDGSAKNTTRIGNSAFIGSDTVLVAPVKVGKKSKVGAGSIVLKGKNIPDNAIAYGIPAQVASRGKRS